MRFEKCGNPNGKTLMLLHGLSSNGQKNFGKIIPLLEQYCIILCDVDGHYADSEFKSVDNCCMQIEEYVKQNFDGKLYSVLGFSMGGSIAVRLMDRGNILIDRAILDAPFCIKLGALTPVFREIFSWATGRISSGKKIPKPMIEIIMGKGNTAIIDMVYEDFTSQTARKVCNEIYRFEISDNLKNFSGKVLFWCGTNEPYPRKSLKELKRHLPHIKSLAFKGMGHGQFINEHSDKYAKLIIKFLTSSKQSGCEP